MGMLITNAGTGMAAWRHGVLLQTSVGILGSTRGYLLFPLLTPDARDRALSGSMTLSALRIRADVGCPTNYFRQLTPPSSNSATRVWTIRRTKTKLGHTIVHSCPLH
jgi:hypothetical protein